ncbi:MAG: threonine synthase [Firmicutes bacterium]|nr:threonine synthase [Bacillota bacterium]
MRYHSTRSREFSVSSAEAIVRGIAPDGGLYMPEPFPTLDWQALLCAGAKETAAAIAHAFFPELADMRALVRSAYTGKFDTENWTPLREVGECYVLELFHGPTSAFKDIALSMLPWLLRRSRAQTGEEREILILTATSGDTGVAAMRGFADVPGMKICVFYPDGGVSAVQRAQMVTQEGANVRVAAVRGNFDDCQTGVKRIFAAAPALPGTVLSSANSINIGRLVPQITYYFQAYSELLARGAVQPGGEVNFAVPTGNFGDILAGYFAKRLGLPVGRLLCASNANRVNADFLATGVYDRRRTLRRTDSPSMDILVSSNLERLLYMASGGDCALVASLLASLAREGRYAVPPELKEAICADFWGDWCDDAQGAQTTGRVFRDNGYLLDPHTAVGWTAAARYREQTGDPRPMVVLATASPFKFPGAVLGAIGGGMAGDEWAQMERLSAISGLPIPANLARLREKAARFPGVIDIADLPRFVAAFGEGKAWPA